MTDNIPDSVPDGITALRTLCDLLGPPLAAGIEVATAYDGIGPNASWRVGTGDSALYLAAQIDAQVGPVDWMIHTYTDDHVTDIRSGMSHGVRMSVVTDTDLDAYAGLAAEAVSA